MERDTCLYIHTRADDGLIFYVGIGTERRPYEVGRNAYWQNVVDKHGYDVHVLLSDLTWEESCQAEQVMIAEFRSEAAGGVARLTNLTDGGEGARGYKFTDEQKAAIFTDEWRRNNTRQLRNLHADPVIRQRHAEATRKLTASPEWLANHATAMRKLAADPNWLANSATANRKLATDLVWRQKVADANSNKSPEWRKNNAAAVRAAKASLTGRGRSSVGQAHRFWNGSPMSSLNPQHYNWLYVWRGKVYPRSVKYLVARGICT